MEEAQLSIDSFVDVVANTVGILIVLALMPIILARNKSVQVDADLAGLERMKEEGGKMRRRLAQLSRKPRLVKPAPGVLRSEVEDALAALKASRAALARAEERAEPARREAGAVASRLEELRAREARARDELAAAARTVAKSVGPVPAAEMDLVRRKSREELRALVSELRDEIASLKGEAEACNARAAESTRRAEGLQGDRRKIEKEIAELMRRSFVTVEIRDPLARIERERKPVWVECYLPEKAVDPDGALRGCVRFVNPENYARDGGVLRPLREGESSLRILDANSAYGAYLSSQPAAYVGRHYLYFIVRPDAYAAFRLARKLAWDAGWRVAWDPVEAGKVIVMGPR